MERRTEHGDLRVCPVCRCSVCVASHAEQMRDYRRRRRESETEFERQRRRLVAEWRAKADRLDDYARRCRRYGDTLEAQDAEQAAVDYRHAADEFEYGVMP